MARKHAGKVERGAYVDDLATVHKNGYVARGAFVEAYAHVHGRVGSLADVRSGVVVEAGANVEVLATLGADSTLKAGVVLPVSAYVHGGYTVWAVISAGFDQRGYHVIAVLCQERNDSGPSNPLEWRVMAGCRDFDFATAEAHWIYNNNPDILAKVAYLKKAVRVWEKTNGKLGSKL